MTNIPGQIIGRAVQSFKIGHTDMSIEVASTPNTAEAFEMVNKNKVEIAVFPGSPEELDRKRYDAFVVGSDRFKLVVPINNSLAYKREVKKTEILNILHDDDVKIIFRERGSGTRNAILAYFDKEAEWILKNKKHVIYNNNDTIISAVFESAEQPIQLVAVVSSVTTRTRNPHDPCVINVVDAEPRNFIAIRKRKNEAADPLWLYIRQNYVLNLCLEKVVETIQGQLGQVLPIEYQHGKKFACSFYRNIDTINLRILPVPSSNIETTWECDSKNKLEEIPGKESRKETPQLFKLHLFLLHKSLTKLRTFNKERLINDPCDVGSTIGNEIVRTEIRIQGAGGWVVLILGTILGAIIVAIFTRFI
jgi:DNA-binding transcriptional LysR family regulator